MPAPHPPTAHPLTPLLAPSSVAIFGASNDPTRISGRSLRYYREAGYKGGLYPINPTRDRDHVGFTFRCARTAGYGVSPAMARRCFEELDSEGIGGRVSVLRALSDTHNVATQGAVWYVGGKVL